MIRLLAFGSLVLLGLLVTPTLAMAQTNAPPKEIRIGMIGLDTSHAPEFTKLINSQQFANYPAKVTIAYPGGSPDLASSRDRVAGFTKQLADAGVRIVDSLDELIGGCDAVLLESVDGRTHLAQATPVIKAGLPLFIDKPLAAGLADALAIHELALQHRARWFSSSSLRFSPSIIRYRTDSKYQGKIVGAFSWGPCPLESTHSDLFWYGIHGVETLYTIMGAGCKTVSRSYTDSSDVVTGIWGDGRIGTFRGIRQGKSGYGAMVFGEDAIEMDAKYEGYAPLVEQILKFFHGGELPIPPEETIELMAFMQAAELSREKHGEAVSIEHVMQQARREIEARSPN